MTPASPRETVRAAERAYDLVQSDPARARVAATEAVALARARRDAEALTVALHALGHARYSLGDPLAARAMREAVRVAARHGLRERELNARRHLALQLAYRGRTRQALVEIDAVHAAQRGLERSRGQVFRLAVYYLAGRIGEVLPDAADALAALRRR